MMLMIEVLILLLAVYKLIRPVRKGKTFSSVRLRQLYIGLCQLKYFLITFSLLGCAVLLNWTMFHPGWKELAAVIFCGGVIEALLFWSGMIGIYLTSVQLGLKWRIIGGLTGMIPLVNLAVLMKLISIVSAEVEFEQEKAELDAVRAESQICQTRYPILLVHGVFFRDYKYLNYWGRIPKELSRNGACIYYGKQQSAASVKECGRELAERILEITAEENESHKKVNIIAHSKGGLDCRYAVACLGMAPYVASITTINTPHHGCKFAEWLLTMAPASFRRWIAKRYNETLRHLGDKNPDFLAAVEDLTASGVENLNREMAEGEQEAAEQVYFQSVASSLKKPSYGRFPLNLTQGFVKLFDGENDGLVSLDSMKWGKRCYEIRVQGKRGVSHGDVIDLNRENIPGFDVREFYVSLIKDLKDRGF
ncbi:MAG: triacylglycerol lipase [Firmicutes bacterium]|nr:triacylglycerol lipase [Bacillota bacterium]